MDEHAYTHRCTHPRTDIPTHKQTQTHTNTALPCHTGNKDAIEKFLALSQQPETSKATMRHLVPSPTPWASSDLFETARDVSGHLEKPVEISEHVWTPWDTSKNLQTLYDISRPPAIWH